MRSSNPVADCRELSSMLLIGGLATRCVESETHCIWCHLLPSSKARGHCASRYIRRAVSHPVPVDGIGGRAPGREAILMSAASFLAENPAAQMRKIAAAAGVSRATLYRHFQSREELIRELQTAAVDEAAHASLPPA